MVHVLMTATYPPSQFDELLKVSAATRMDYPAYLKKLFDWGVSDDAYKNYTLYEIDDAKLTDGLKTLGLRYHKIATAVDGYGYRLEVLRDGADMIKGLKK